MNKRGKVIFIVISVCLPFIILLLLESGLRVFHLGINLNDLFLTTADNQYYYMNKDISKRYFTIQQATTGNTEFFRKNKDTATVRIFVLGESAALGFPYPNNISFQRMLKYALQKTHSQKQIEIINLSLTAINSYTFYDFGKELYKYDPDAIIIYGGHNEYYGALGVGSTSTFGNNPLIIHLIIELRQLKTVQMLERLLNKITVRKKTDFSDNLMKYVVKNQFIKYNSNLFRKGTRQFEKNLTLLLSELKRRNIPVFLSTVATNLKDQYPFQSCFSKSTDSLYYCNQLSIADTYLKENKISEADAIVRKLYAIDSTYASCAYLLGKINYQKGNYDDAYQLFIRAQRYDCLRFRAPEEINKIIIQLAKSFPNVQLVDVWGRFKEISKHGIPGRELFLEHVHPTIQGHKEIAKSFYIKIKSSEIIKGENMMNPDSAFSSFPVLEFDSLAGEYASTKLKRGFPFYEETDLIQADTEIEKLALNYTIEKNWFKSMIQLYQYAVSVKDFSLALDIIRVRILDNMYDSSFYPVAGELCTIMERYDEALFYYEKGFMLNPSFGISQNIISVALRNDKPEEAFRYIDYAILNNTGSINFQKMKEHLWIIIRLKEELLVAKGIQKKDICLDIAAKYLMLGNRNVSENYYQKALSFN